MRLIIAALYLVLAVGAVTMVYPFLLMLGTSITSGADVNGFQIVPMYLYNKAGLFPKYAEDRYAGDLDLINQSYGTDFSKINKVTPPNNPITPQAKRMVEDWGIFVSGLPISYKQTGFEGYGSAPSKLRMVYQKYCEKRFGGDIARLNRLYVEENDSFRTVSPPFERFKMREWEPDDSPKMREWLSFKKSLPDYFVRPILIDPAFRTFLQNGPYGESIKNLNAAWRTDYKSYDEVRLRQTARHPAGATRRLGIVRAHPASF